MQHHNDTRNKQTNKDFFRKICTSHFIVRVRKGYSRFYCERELETEQNGNILTPHSYGRQRCVFLVLLMLNQRSGGSAFCWVLAFSTTSCHQRVFETTGGPEAPSAGSGFPYHILSATSLDPNSSGPQGPPPPSFFTTSCLLTRLNSNCLTSCLDWFI